MPDWMSHLLIGLILAEIFNIKKTSLVIFGALLPDLLSKFYLISFYFGIDESFPFSYLHTPVLSILVGILIAPLFRYDRIKTTAFISLGIASHFLSDLTMRHFHAGMFIFFPFSTKAYTLNWVWPEQSIYVLIGTFIVYTLIRVVKKVNSERIKI